MFLQENYQILLIKSLSWFYIQFTKFVMKNYKKKHKSEAQQMIKTFSFSIGHLKLIKSGLLICFFILIPVYATMFEEFEWTDQEVENLKEKYKECLLTEPKEDFPNMFQSTFVHNRKIDETKDYKNILVIDFGGTSLKLGLYDKVDGKILQVFAPQIIKIPEEEQIKEVDAFAWVAQMIKTYLKDKKGPFIAGMTFSYAMEQTSIDSGLVLLFAKNFHFKNKNETNLNPVECLNAALKDLDLEVEVKAISNDTVATLMSVYHSEKDHRIGIVLGTGTNASFFKKKSEDGTFEAINLEWASFTSDAFKKTDYDLQLEHSLQSKGNETEFLDRFVGGYGFLEILNLAAQHLLDRTENVSLEDVKNVLKDPISDKCLFSLVYIIKKRAIKVLSAMTMSIIETLDIENGDSISLILNGTLFEHNFDFRMFFDEMKSFMERKGNQTPLNIYVPSDASLIGMANILISEIM